MNAENLKNLFNLIMTHKKNVVLSLIILMFALMLLVIIKSDKHETVLSKEAMNDLVAKAANYKYLQDVFAGDKVKLPNKTQLSKTLPITNTATSTFTSSAVLAVAPTRASRCNYNGQDYVAGDIVKNDNGWMRCVPLLIFTSDKPTTPQQSGVGWVTVQ